MERTALALLALIAAIAFALILTSTIDTTDHRPCWRAAPGETCG